MDLPLNEIHKAKKLLQEAENILIISHRNPDADTVGTNLALKLALFQWGKHVTSACADPLPQDSHFLPGYNTFVQDVDLSDYDVVVSVDVGAHYLLKYDKTHPELLDKEKTTLINIDHHPSNDHFGSVNIVVDTAAATALILFYILKEFELTLTRDIATCLLAGIYFDTGSFMHSNTTPEVYDVAGQLMSHGADFKVIVKKLFHTTPVNQMKLWGRILNRARINKKNIVSSAVTQKDLNDLGLTVKEVSGVIDYLNAVPGSQFCILLSEDLKGNVKASLRTQRDDVDLSELTSTFGGGGHKKAAGFTMPGKIEQETVWKISPPDQGAFDDEVKKPLTD